jgi:ABC-type nitrate/sulfonate/bicarbonate transport system permease component
MKKLSSFMGLGFIYILWTLLVYLKILDDQFFPSPFFILKRLFFLFQEAAFVYDCMRSSWRLLAGFLISFPCAILLAFLCSHFKIMDSFFNPIIAFTFPLPKVAIFPLLLLIFGIGDAAKIAIIATGMFYLMFISMRLGMLSLKQSVNGEIVKIYRIKGFNYYYHFLLKGILIDVLSGIKLGFGYGLTLVVVSEFSMSKDGIGNFIWKSWDQFKIIDMYAGIFLLCFAGFGIYLSLGWLISRQLPSSTRRD